MAKVTKDELREQLEDVQDQLDEANDLIARLERHTNVVVEQFVDIQEENEGLYATIDDLETQLLWAQEEAQGWEGAVEEYDEEVASLLSQRQFLNQTLTAILAYRGDNVEVVRGLAFAAVSEFASQDSLEELV